MSAPKALSFETGHAEMIHDAQFDYFGKRVATASSDRTIKLFSLSGDKQTFLCDLKGHEGPVWQVSWAHPKHGTILASCSYDGKVIIWKETQGWKINYVKVLRQNGPAPIPVNSISWAPSSFGLVLAAATADGFISILSFSEEKNVWDINSFLAHPGGVNAVSWGPDIKTGALVAKSGSTPQTKTMRLVTGGCDNRVYVWRFSTDKPKWVKDRFKNDENKHSDWVRDVAWAPSLGLPTNTIASASEDKTVVIWNEDIKTGVWYKKQELKFQHKVWRVSWSVMGNILAVSQGDNNVSLWKQSMDGSWQNLSSMKEVKEKKDR